MRVLDVAVWIDKLFRQKKRHENANEIKRKRLVVLLLRYQSFTRLINLKSLEWYLHCQDSRAFADQLALLPTTKHAVVNVLIVCHVHKVNAGIEAIEPQRRHSLSF